MEALEKARAVTLVRKQYEEAETREERIRLARLLEEMNRDTMEATAQ